jgi:HlyD family secretion protein
LPLLPFLDPRSRREAEERLGPPRPHLERESRRRTDAGAGRPGEERSRAHAHVERGASTKQALERAELAMRVGDRDLRAAEFQHEAAEPELEQVRALLARYGNGANAALEGWNVTAPVPGLVLKIAQESETIIQPGSPIMEVGDPRDLEIMVDVLSTDAVEIRPGMEVAIENWGGQGVLLGRVRRVEPAAFTKISTLGVEEQRVNVLVDISSSPEQWSGLGDGYRVNARISVFTREDATIVPAGALFRRGESWNVFVVEGGRAQTRAVTLLRRSGRVAAIATGLTPGERVIVYPSDRVTLGVRVEAR